MRQIKTLGVERPWDVIVWDVAHIGGWLHLVTVFFTLCKWTGILDLRWGVVFLPSLFYGTLVVLLGIGSSTIFALSRWNQWLKPLHSFNQAVFLSTNRPRLRK